MTHAIDRRLVEASDPQTSPKRLRQLGDWKRRHERARLRQAIAANPNADDDLLCSLASDHPREVVCNPRFQLLQLSSETWWEDWDAHSLCSLALAAGKDTSLSLKSALRSRYKEIHDFYSENVSISRRETWCYARSIESRAGDSAGRIPFDIHLEVRLEVLMEGSNNVWLDNNRGTSDFCRDWVSSFMQSLRNQDIESLFEIFGHWEDLHDIVVENEVAESISISTTNPKLKIKDRAVLLKATGETLFVIDAFYSSDEEARPSFSDGVLQVPIFEHIGNDNSEGPSLGCHDDLGILEAFWGWEPCVLAPEIPKDSWVEWLCDLIVS
ncbi:MAG: hypothetical protein VKJ44_03460 [Synechococcus sp.]|nr:hypothetical protein [Synechococcus sp.]